MKLTRDVIISLLNLSLCVHLSQSTVMEKLKEALPTVKEVYDDAQVIGEQLGKALDVAYEKIETGLNDSSLGWKTPELIRDSGYNFEAHEVTTEDGYILTLHRIPGPPNAPIVFLQHGITESSSCWVLSGKGNALAYLLADRGYDVWLGNARGNIYSQGHVSLSVNDTKYWQFSWHEMGIYDIPAVLSYLTSIRNDKVIYIGHSMGTTMAYVMSILRPDAAQNVSAIYSLAPVAYCGHAKSPVRFVTPFLDEIELISDYLAHGEFVPRNKLAKYVGMYLCDWLGVAFNGFCTDALFFLFGFDNKRFNDTLTPSIVAHTLAGSSIRELTHYGQLIKSHKFEQFDWGKEENKRIYGDDDPPEYDLSKVNVPVALFWARNDWLADTRDVRRLRRELPRVIADHPINYNKFNHIDFLWGLDAKKLVYSPLIQLIESFSLGRRSSRRPRG
ncbi:lipase 3-like isoform X1 [Trichogramma pretiosum]|uniref:lipase 3-like isoform X1 n=1 Tax=Trichogramma pretiosum TaxID=7493 RepID=UPI0006C95441|nr:lipase 3-like isoform X1 [Trichogramma pretiosum]XP_023314154.1 lipase 3-like isoform X1 [Trichogramma pretiosum]